ncbi:MAG: SH3 domain-containing protein [Clostridia bacterium]|nr:SH3 domain-containing protein [Clostridia bacterium]
MKRKLVALLLIVSLIGIAPMALAARTAYVDLPSNYTALNVRSGPGTNYSVSGWVVEGDEIEILKEGSTWTKIRVVRSGKSGYIKNAYIDGSSGGSSQPSQPSTPSTSGSATAGRVTGNGVNLRKGAGSSYAKVATLSRGTKLMVWTSSGNWAYVSTLSGTSGWMSKTYIATGYTTTTNARVNFRESINGAVIRTLNSGESVTVHSMTGAWSKVTVGNTTGYIYTRYLN